MSYTPEPYVHYSTTDTLYAWPIADPPWTDAGIIAGDDSAVPGTFVFTGLVDGVNYYVCIQAGTEPAEGDPQDGLIVFPLPDIISLTAIRIGDTAFFRHKNNTDTLDAIVLTTGPWSASGAVAGDNSAEPGKYVFAELADDTAYEIRIRAGAEPAVGDVAIAGIPVPIEGGGGGGVYPVTVLTPEQASGNTGSTITIVQGDDYTGSRALPIEIVSEADLTDQYMIIAISRSGTPGFSFRGKVYTNDEKQYFNVSLTKAQSKRFVTGPWDYIIRLESAIDQESQISHGTWQVNGFTTPSPILGTPRT